MNIISSTIQITRLNGRKSAITTNEKYDPTEIFRRVKDAVRIDVASRGRDNGIIENIELVFFRSQFKTEYVD